jgi:hypothetical protein
MPESYAEEDVSFAVYLTALTNAIARCAAIHKASPARTLRALQAIAVQVEAARQPERSDDV